MGLGGEVRTARAGPAADTGNGEPLTRAGASSTWQYIWPAAPSVGRGG